MKTTCTLTFSGHENFTLPNGKQMPMYKTGQVVSGIAKINSTSQVKTNKITILGGFRVNGKGSPETFLSNLSECKIDCIEPQKPVEIPFSMQIPDNGPMTYDGKYVKIDWFIRVSIDIPWAFDEHTYHYFIVAASIDDDKHKFYFSD